MSKMLQVRNVPDELHEALRRRAADRGQSLSDFVLGELERAVARPPVEDVLSRASRRGGHLGFDEALTELHRERDERG